jgi:hypothetical protein
MLVIMCLALCPAAASASDKTLYEISAETISLLDGFSVCLAADSCSADDFALLKAGATISLTDGVRLLKSGNAQAMKLTFRQAGTLMAKVRQVKAQLSLPTSPQQACGMAMQMIIFAWLSFLSAFAALFQPEAAAAALVVAQGLPTALYSFMIGILMTLGGIILYPACLL